MPDPAPFDTSTMLCPWCSVMHAFAPCERCQALIDSGRNRGPMPSFLVPRAESGRGCWACRTPDPDKHPDPSRAVFCDRHAELAARRRRTVPLEYDKPQTPRLVARRPQRREWFP
jgi:hypothetical protein